MTRLVPAVLAAAFLLAGCAGQNAPVVPAEAAGPQVANLDWVEPFPKDDPALVFRVETLRVTASGWEAVVAIENRSSERYEVPPPAASSDLMFGLMIFERDDLDDLERRAREGRLPPLREAQTSRPRTPPILAPGETWHATIAAAGALPVGRWVRVVFGPLTPLRAELDDDGNALLSEKDTVVWFTDHAYRLRP